MKTKNDMELAIQELFDGLTTNYRKTMTDLESNAEGEAKVYRDSLTYKVGKKYIRLMHRGAALGFIVNAHDDKKFAYGTLLKPAGWSAPARNFSRGNVFAISVIRLRWTGIA
jgi:hypothetical protein